MLVLAALLALLPLPSATVACASHRATPFAAARSSLAMLRTEPFEQTRRAQERALLEAPQADLRRFLSDDERARFHAYRRPRWMGGLANLLLQGALLALLVRSLGARIYAACARAQERLAATLATREKLRERLQPLSRAMDRLWSAPDWPAALLFAAALAVVEEIALWPASLVFDWLLPRQQGLSQQTLARWMELSMLGLVTQSLGLAALAFGLWGLMRRVRRVWLWLGVPAGALVVLAGLGDPLSLQVRNTLRPLEAGPARAAIESVLERAGVQAEAIDVMNARRDGESLDAFVIGQGPTRRIVLYDTLVEALTPAQLGAVVAHELGHLDRSRAARALAAGATIPLLLWLAGLLLAWSGPREARAGRPGRASRFGFRDGRDVRALPLLLLAAWMLATAASPVANLAARDRELRADLFALDLTRDPASLRGALLQLARKNQLDPAPPALVAALLYDHPTLARRLGLVDAWEAAAARGER